MSRKKIRIRKPSQSTRKDQNRFFVGSSIPRLDHTTGEIDMNGFYWEVNRTDMDFLELYGRAHNLMPSPQSVFMDPDEYLDEMEPCIELLKKAQDGEQEPSADLLRALGILGHTPHDRSIAALSLFADSSHYLAPVANLAFDECTGLYAHFRCTSKAS